MNGEFGEGYSPLPLSNDDSAFNSCKAMLPCGTPYGRHRR